MTALLRLITKHATVNAEVFPTCYWMHLNCTRMHYQCIKVEIRWQLWFGISCCSKFWWWNRLQPEKAWKSWRSHPGNTGSIWAPWRRWCIHQHQVYDSVIWVVHAQLIYALTIVLRCFVSWNSIVWSSLLLICLEYVTMLPYLVPLSLYILTRRKRSCSFLVI